MQPKPFPLLDIGVNLSHESFDHDRDDVVERALQAGLQAMILTGTSVEGSVQAAALAATQPGLLYSTAGVHPHEAANFGIDTSARLHAILQQPQVVAVGETGLDFFRDFSPRPLQEQAFAEQLTLAGQCGLPVFLHQRDAHARFLPMLREQRDQLCRGVV
ncbi:MAG TPA: hydrolase TatD, partial [Pseudomonadaceae bacterium]|nr:hydrolase TatD [Pseudomonadaceae bacterium]